jgi:hypothetical protein
MTLLENDARRLKNDQDGSQDDLQMTLECVFIHNSRGRVPFPKRGYGPTYKLTRSALTIT